MCQLLGMNCKEPATINFSLDGFVARGGLTDEHKDGWGIAFFEENRWQRFVDEKPAAHSPLSEQIKQQHIKSRTILAHIRKATVGDVELRNCHPFQRKLWGQDWIFTHNGTLKEFHPPLNGRFSPEGETDSELAFCYLLQQLEIAFPLASEDNLPNSKALYDVLVTLSHEIAAYGVFNIMLSNGHLLFTHCTTLLAYVKREYPFTRATLIDRDLSLDLSEHNSPIDRMILVATKPLTSDENWIIYREGESLLFNDGLLLYGSHGAESATEALILESKVA